jgi:hypothetical protein
MGMNLHAFGLANGFLDITPKHIKQQKKTRQLTDHGI